MPRLQLVRDYLFAGHVDQKYQLHVVHFYAKIVDQLRESILTIEIAFLTVFIYSALSSGKLSDNRASLFRKVT